MRETLTLQDLFTVYRSDLDMMEPDDLLDAPLVVENRKYRSVDGAINPVIPKQYGSVKFEPGWMTLTFSHEEDKKALYNIFHNSGMRVPMHYDKSKALTVYYDGPRHLGSIDAPDAIIDNDVVEVNMSSDPSGILEVLDAYFAQKERVVGTK